MALTLEQAIEADDAELSLCIEHGGYDHCGIYAFEAQAESAWLRVAEAGYPGYDYDPNDPEATGW